ncbi:Sarcolemmal membrane-associated protein [Toxocara canis]|uniref:Sarcolemmal membrane-associated protein n=1 Tax=Toxocara canis TaxID=6265 RepID=A0A0B2UY55_TOXCA|nr:Sarcolemmal membrane-associated protein [Toxocara canis]
MVKCARKWMDEYSAHFSRTVHSLCNATNSCMTTRSRVRLLRYVIDARYGMNALSEGTANMTGPRGPYAILTACSQSHAFDERRFRLPCSEEDALKIGRSVARFKPSNDNAIFDCKVLSRNHAIMWYEEGAFLLKDTKSSNGTFVNSERLSKSAEESSPRQIFSGDILQFGVEIVENANKVVHGCIVAMVRLFDAKGEEVSPPEVRSLGRRELEQLSIGSPLINSHQLFQLHQYIREAAHREHMLEQKLATLEGVLTSTEQAAESSWQALINEDRLLSRIEMLEGQLALYSKNVSSDKVKEEMSQLLVDKNKFETLAKDSLRRSIEEKNEALQRLADVERSLVNTEEESAVVRKRAADLEHELESALATNTALNETITQLKRQLRSAELKQQSLSSSLPQEQFAPVDDEDSLKERLSDIITSEAAQPEESNEITMLRNQLFNLANENSALRARLAQLESNHENKVNATDESATRQHSSTGETVSEGTQDVQTPILLLLVLPFFAFFFICVRLGARLAVLRPKID